MPKQNMFVTDNPSSPGADIMDRTPRYTRGNDPKEYDMERKKAEKQAQKKARKIQRKHK